jgi:hypothetical protein
MDLRIRQLIVSLLLLMTYTAALFLVVTFTVFLALDVSDKLRGALGLGEIRYYALKERYVADPKLVFRPRHIGVTSRWETKGDLYSSDLPFNADLIKFTWTLSDDGFRPNTSVPPYQLLIIGDSFVEIGETDTDTLSERLARESGMTTFNLGRGWYGPQHYLELLLRYGPRVKPSCVMFAFFSGNDIRDVREYDSWASGGFYYDWLPERYGLVQRYLTVVMDTYTFASRRLRELLPVSHDRSNYDWHREWLGYINLGNKETPAIFGYPLDLRTANEALSSQDWIRFREILRQFSSAAERMQILPIVAFIPTKLEVYSHLISQRSSPSLLRHIMSAPQRNPTAEILLESLSQEMGIPFIDLFPDFVARANKGELLYYPFDTHWNKEGRQAAAESIAGAMERMPGLCART